MTRQTDQDDSSDDEQTTDSEPSDDTSKSESSEPSDQLGFRVPRSRKIEIRTTAASYDTDMSNYLRKILDHYFENKDQIDSEIQEADTGNPRTTASS